MATYQIEIDAPIIIRLQAQDSDEAEALGDQIYAALHTEAYNAIQRYCEHHNLNANLAARYDHTEVIEDIDLYEGPTLAAPPLVDSYALRDDSGT